MVDITTLTQIEINDALAQLKQLSEYPTPSTQYARVLRKYITSLVEALEKAQTERDEFRNRLKLERAILEDADKRIAELDRMESALRPVGVMSQKAYHRLENRESRFIALWPRPEIYLPRKRPDDGVIVYARTAGIQVIEGEGHEPSN